MAIRITAGKIPLSKSPCAYANQASASISPSLPLFTRCQRVRNQTGFLVLLVLTVEVRRRSVITACYNALLVFDHNRHMLVIRDPVQSINVS